MNSLKSIIVVIALIFVAAPFNLSAQAGNDSLLAQLSLKWANAKVYALKDVAGKFTPKIVKMCGAETNRTRKVGKRDVVEGE